MTKRIFRLIEILLSLLTLFVLAASFYFQYQVGLQPCPLCLMQRFMVFALLFFVVSGLTLGTLKRAGFVAFSQMIFALCGLYFSGRQLWLQSLSSESVPACMPGLDVLMKYFPWQDIARALVFGGGDCAEKSWQWLGLSMPGWSFLYFLFMFLVSGGLYWAVRQCASDR